MPAALNPTLAWIVGRATLTIVVSSTTISWTVASSTSAPIIGAVRWAFAVPPPPARAPRGALAGRSLSLVRMVQSSGCHRRPGWPAHYPIWHILPFLSIFVIYASVSHETTPLSERPARRREAAGPASACSPATGTTAPAPGTSPGEAGLPARTLCRHVLPAWAANPA